MIETIEPAEARPVETVVHLFLTEAWHRGDPVRAAEFLDEAVLIYRRGIVERGRDAWLRLVGEFRAAAPEGALVWREMLVDGDLVAIEWELVDAGRAVLAAEDRGEPAVDLAGLAIFRVVGGRITDLWDHPGARLDPEPAESLIP